ncbi:MAG TPA: RNA polymerase sigma factor [Burkholderiales bacterium]|jgi:RNA polymerase sigma-70 factor (ECF subfamily)|nr:RNA polymerase sigma factor [Burkholderiales bacterium]
MPPVSPFRRVRAAASPYRRARPDALNFEDLLRPHVEYLYRLAWRFSGSVADAEDLVQDVLLKLYPRTQELLEIQRLRPWLARVLYHQYVDSFRQKARSPVVELVTDAEGADDALDTTPAARDGPEEHAERNQWRERILAALQRLNPEQRAVVAMHDVEGYTLEELETILATPLGTLKSRLHRARERLRALLPMEPFSDGERVNE